MEELGEGWRVNIIKIHCAHALTFQGTDKKNLVLKKNDTKTSRMEGTGQKKNSQK